MKNTYEHISFRNQWDIDVGSSNLLGQCFAYIQAISRTPIRPDYRYKLLRVSLARGAQATTAIEGNTLSDSEVEAIQNGAKLSPSKEYLQKEVSNILDAFNTILVELVKERTATLITCDLIKRFHKMVGDGIGEAFNASPGVFRRSNVVVGQYRPPSFERVESLTEELCVWLRKEFHYQQGQIFNEIVIQAIVTHVYIAWIHPFGDGNGRTARLLEFYLLLRAGVPDIASHILSNHYNNTRNEYYRYLQRATETGSLSEFIKYALVGFRDGLAEVLDVIHENQTDVTWRNYVHDKVEQLREKGKNDKTLKRLRGLAYATPSNKPQTPAQIRILSEEISKSYEGRSTITLTRDLNLLVIEKLLIREGKSYRANKAVLREMMALSTSQIKNSD